MVTILRTRQAPAAPDPDALRASRSRHPGDLVRVVVGLVVLGLGLLAVERDRLTGFERDLFRLVNDLPAVLGPLLVAVMQAGNVVAGPLAASAALVARARRMAFDLAVAGPVAWFAAKAVKRIVERPRPGGLLDDVLRYGSSDGLGFISGHTAVAAALATAAGPYLSRPWRRVLWAVAWAVGFARVYEGAHLPLDIVGGAAVGWVVGAALHLLLGAPHRVPGLDDARRVLARTGLQVHALTRVPGTPKGSFPFVGSIGDEAVFVKLLDPEPRDRDLLFRMARFLVFRDVRDEAALVDPAAQADHEAAMTLLARSVGCRVPAIRGIEHVGSTTWLTEDVVEGTSLTRLPPEAVDDEVLRDIWRQLAALRRARLAHRDLVADNVMVDGHRHAWIVDFAHAESSASERALDNDVAELLATTALVVGPERAVASASASLDADALARALPELQPLALTAATRQGLRRHPGLLGRLRDIVAVRSDATDTDVEHPPTAGPASVVRLAGPPLVAVAALLVLVGAQAVGSELSSGSWRWVGAAVVASVASVLAAAAAWVAATGRRLGLGRTVAVHVLATGSGAADGERVVLRYLQRCGVTAAEGERVLARVKASRMVVWSAGLVVTAAAMWDTGAEWRRPEHLPALLATAVATAVAVGATSRRRRRVRPDLRAAFGVEPAARTVLWASVVASFGFGALSLVASVKATGGSVAVAAVLFVFLAATASARLAPGVTEVAMVVGLSAAGMAGAPALAAVVLARLLGFWVPVAAAPVLSWWLARRLVL